MTSWFALGIFVGGWALAIWLRQKGRVGTCWLVLIGTVIVARLLY